MGQRTPPYSGSRWAYGTDLVVVLSKEKTAKGVRFQMRRVWREIWNAEHRGEIVAAVRYGNKARRLYNPKDFQTQLAKWSDGSTAVYYPNGRRMTATKPRQRFLFDFGRPLWTFYD